jgi:hypothetical protein
MVAEEVLVNCFNFIIIRVKHASVHVKNSKRYFCYVGIGIKAEYRIYLIFTPVRITCRRSALPTLCFWCYGT